MIPHLSRNHNKDPQLPLEEGKGEALQTDVIAMAPIAMGTNHHGNNCHGHTHHGCNCPVSAVVEDVKVFPLQVANHGGYEDHWDPYHKQSVVRRTENTDLQDRTQPH